ncbi:MAG TPA: tRNA (adenosine(37)-N6)-dimethylallyltransferase MiaA [Aminobacterium sp.]|jgi:tRNA dimethylallyltransferase|uniref:tRNA (adenosine(37)-N6)-dimethylallyltransferase MiaA n=1 Tax=Aminobacterium TaxID=81466 RepID=UPI000EC78716|nr:tRNA (adenosine(37)-N6)-dimethylallyltransferase MiaA [Aminobacterium sp. UBA4834]HCA40329.1 tRNA (adenosine(37)-N6)-dimethylallyltransferase MiaA [Aminobacterium sp.]
MNIPHQLIAIIGPTAVGKTQLSLYLAERLNAEIISVDSRQVYRYMDVGTDKVSPEIQRHILHHLLNVVDPDEIFSAADFVERSMSCIKRIATRGHVPLFVGGTPFYYQALFEGVLTQDLPRDRDVTDELEMFAQQQGNSALHAKLADVDPVRASQLHENDVRRVSRALEIYTLTGKTATWWYSQGKERGAQFCPLYIGLNRPRPLLFQTIEKRVREQFSTGFVEEVEWLLAHGFDERFPSMQGFGYKEIVEYLRGSITKEEAIEGDISATKKFSRRQMTWFKKFSPTLWYDISDRNIESLSSEVYDAYLRHLERGNEI